MLSIQKDSTNTQTHTPHLLPARINHDGPVEDTQKYWKPEVDDKGKHHAYFRGRHLHGTALSLPHNYTGAILRVTEKDLPQTQTQPQGQAHKRNQEDDDEEDGEESDNVDVKIAEQIGSFDEFVVWGHGEEVDAGRDMYVRGLREWVGFAEAMHGEEAEE
ncbi:ribonuclease H2, subunit C, partial [Massariosphaeria phaeospora]